LKLQHHCASKSTMSWLESAEKEVLARDRRGAYAGTQTETELVLMSSEKYVEGRSSHYALENLWSLLKHASLERTVALNHPFVR